MSREPVGFINDGKMHAVLDTNVIINAMWGLSLGKKARSVEVDSLFILHAVGSGRVVPGVTTDLMKEYTNKAHEHFNKTNGRLDGNATSWVMRTILANRVGLRMLVNPPRASRDPDDDILFDGLSATYLVSENLKDVRPDRLLPGFNSAYTYTVLPSAFVDILRKQSAP